MNTVHQVSYNVPFIIVIDFLPGMLLCFFMCACLLNYRKKIDVVILVHKKLSYIQNQQRKQYYAWT